MELTKQQLTEANAIVLRETGYAMTEQYLKKLASVLQYPQPTELTDEQWNALCEDISDRRGLKWEWEKIDDNVKLAIRYAWEAIIFSSRRTAEPHPVAKGPCSVCSDGGIDYCKIHGPMELG